MKKARSPLAWLPAAVVVALSPALALGPLPARAAADATKTIKGVVLLRGGLGQAISAQAMENSPCRGWSGSVALGSGPGFTSDLVAGAHVTVRSANDKVLAATKLEQGRVKNLVEDGGRLRTFDCLLSFRARVPSSKSYRIVVARRDEVVVSRGELKANDWRVEITVETPEPGQPDLGKHANSVRGPATDDIAIRVYEAVDRVYAARARFFADGAACIGVRNDDCFGLLVDLSSAVASQRDTATEIASSADTSTECGKATLLFVNTINLLYEGVSPFVDLSNTVSGSTLSEESVRAEAADSDIAYNEGLYDFRKACGESAHPTPSKP